MAALARSTGRVLTVVPQATGHGAGATVDEDVVLFDTSKLDSVTIDPQTRVATVGAGATWSAVNAAAEQHGLLGLAGSAPSVVRVRLHLRRRDRLAGPPRRSRQRRSSRRPLRRRPRSSSAWRPTMRPTQLDRDAIWAFRGAGGVGIAHTLELDLVPAPDLHAGALLWPGARFPSSSPPGRAPSALSAPGCRRASRSCTSRRCHRSREELHGTVAVHLAIADPDGPDAAAPLLDAMRAAAAPVVDDWGPKDAAGLARIHLDPPTATPAIGDARWLDASTPDIAEALLTTAAADDSPIVMMEIRHVAGAPTRRDGAVVTPPGDFIYHAVGAARPLHPAADRRRLRAGPGRLDARRHRPDARVVGRGCRRRTVRATRRVRQRARAVAHAVDPDRRLSRSRLLG